MQYTCFRDLSFDHEVSMTWNQSNYYNFSLNVCRYLVHLQEGKELLDGEELGKTRAQTKAEKNGDAESEQNGKHDQTDGKEAEGDSSKNGGEAAEEEDEEKAALKRTRTMEETVKVCG